MPPRFNTMMIPPTAASRTMAAATMAMIITGLFLAGAPWVPGGCGPGPAAQNPPAEEEIRQEGAVRPLRAVAALWRIALLGWLLLRITAGLLRRISGARLLGWIARAGLLRRIATRTLRRVAALLTPVWRVLRHGRPSSSS